jgi:hypothetical protein
MSAMSSSDHTDKVLNSTALLLFDLFAFSKGYRFTRVRTPEQESHFDLVHHEAGFSFPPEIEEKISTYKNGTIRFIAFCCCETNLGWQYT